MSAVWDGYPGNSTPELLTLLALADWCDDEGGNCYPSIDALGKKCRLSRSQTQRIIHRLIDAEIVLVIGNEYGGNKKATRRYRIDLAKLTGSKNATGSKSALDGSQKCAETGRENATQYISEPSIKASVKERARARKSVFCLPADFPADAWGQFVAMRVSLKKPMTPGAMKLAVEKLLKLQAEGQDIAAVLNQSTFASWANLYEVKPNGGTHASTWHSNRNDQRAATLNELTGRTTGRTVESSTVTVD